MPWNASGCVLGVRVALTLAGDRVDDDRAIGALGALDGLLHLGDVVPVDRADVLEAELLEEHAGHEQLLDRLLDRFAGADHHRGRPSSGASLDSTSSRSRV